MTAEVVGRRLYGTRAKAEELDQPSALTSTMLGEHLGFRYGSGRLATLATLHLPGDVIDLRFFPSEEFSKGTDLPTRIKYVWNKPVRWEPVPGDRFIEAFSSGITHVISVEVYEGDISQSVFSVTTISDWDAALQQTEPEPSMWRGVFSPRRRKKVLFSQTINVRTAELPRRRPDTAINLRRLANEDG